MTNLLEEVGSDTADYTGVASDIIANVSTNATGNDIGVDIYSGIENITGGIGKDTLTGSSGDNTLKGMEGDDTISELAGNDIVEGGAGNDYIYAGAGDDIIDGDDTDSGTTNGTSDTLDFTLISINDDSGDTRDVDGTGSDTTTVDAYNGIEIDLSLTTAQRIHAEYGTDTITNIENVIGSNKNDYIQGTIRK
jgi:Ca2+-binding RTX toxin-like protein